MIGDPICFSSVPVVERFARLCRDIFNFDGAPEIGYRSPPFIDLRMFPFS